MGSKYVIKHDHDAIRDTKISQLLYTFGGAAYGLFWMIVEQLYYNGNTIVIQEIYNLAYMAKVSEKDAQNIVDFMVKVGLLLLDDNGNYSSKRVGTDLESLKKKQTIYSENIKKRWSKSTFSSTELPLNNDSNTIESSYSYSYSNIKEETKVSKKKFQKPSINEIEHYCNERNNSINAEQFYSFYESKGWMIGKNHMKDWKAAVRTWEAKEKTKEPPKKEKEISEYERQFGVDRDHDTCLVIGKQAQLDKLARIRRMYPDQEQMFLLKLHERLEFVGEVAYV